MKSHSLLADVPKMAIFPFLRQTRLLLFSLFYDTLGPVYLPFKEPLASFFSHIRSTQKKKKWDPAQEIFCDPSLTKTYNNNTMAPFSGLVHTLIHPVPKMAKKIVGDPFGSKMTRKPIRIDFCPFGGLFFRNP